MSNRVAVLTAILLTFPYARGCNYLLKSSNMRSAFLFEKNFWKTRFSTISQKKAPPKTGAPLIRKCQNQNQLALPMIAPGEQPSSPARGRRSEQIQRKIAKIREKSRAGEIYYNYSLYVSIIYIYLTIVVSSISIVFSS